MIFLLENSSTPNLMYILYVSKFTINVATKAIILNEIKTNIMLTLDIIYSKNIIQYFHPQIYMK